MDEFDRLLSIENRLIVDLNDLITHAEFALSIGEALLFDLFSTDRSHSLLSLVNYLLDVDVRGQIGCDAVGQRQSELFVRIVSVENDVLDEHSSEREGRRGSMVSPERSSRGWTLNEIDFVHRK